MVRSRMFRRLMLLAILSAASPAVHAQVVSLVAGQAIPMGRRVFISEGNTYVIEGITVLLEVRGIIQRHLAEGGRSESAVLVLTEGAAHTELPVGLSSATTRARFVSNGLRFTVFAIHHTGGIELSITRAPHVR